MSWKKLPTTFNISLQKMNNKAIKTEIQMAIGHASMCWKPIPKGVFDSTEALKVAEKLYRKVIKFKGKAKNAHPRKTKSH